MTYPLAQISLARAGPAQAAGDQLRAMCASLVSDLHGGHAATYYAALTGTDAEVRTKAKELLADRAAAYAILLR